MKENITDLTYKISSLLTTVYVLNNNKKHIKFRSKEEKDEWGRRTNAIRQRAYRLRKKLKEARY